MAKRYKMLAFGLAAAAALSAAVWRFGFPQSDNKYSVQTFAMDTVCTMTKYGDNDFSALKARISELDKLFSAYDTDSEIYKLNQQGSIDLSDDCRQLLEEFVSLYDEYGEVTPVMGAVIDLWDVTGDNPHVPDDEQINAALETADIENLTIDNGKCTLQNGAKLNLGAVAKGFALDKVKQLLDEEDCSCAVVTFGSSTLLYGEKPDGSDFTVSVRCPDDDTAQLLEFSCSEGFVSTSGGYERYFEADGQRYIHIFDLSNGCPVQTDLTSVTVICGSGIVSDFLSTRIFIGGTQEINSWLERSGIAVIAADEQGNIYCSDSIAHSVEIKAEGFDLVF